MSKAASGGLPHARRLVTTALGAVLIADLVVVVTASPHPLRHDSAQSKIVVADPAVAQLLTGMIGPGGVRTDAPRALRHEQQSAVSVVAASPARKKKPQPTLGDSVIGAVGGLAGALASGATGGGGSSPGKPGKPKSGHHPKSGGSGGKSSGASPPAHVPSNASHAAPRVDLQYVPSYTVLAKLKQSAAGFANSHTTARKMTVPKAWYGRTSVMPVTDSSSTRVKVRLARRPDESQAWVRRKTVTLSSTTYALLIDISKHRIYLFKSGRQVASYPVGVGLPQTPTPTGNYFIAFHAPPNGPGYGPVMLETSAHSQVFQSFEGGDDAIIAIHGPITSQSDAAIGSNGTRISNGCIRMHNSQLVKIARVPDGTPIILAP
jgi:lipoprotein-anchoring transpeptidase ErfK/SrfK